MSVCIAALTAAKLFSPHPLPAKTISVSPSTIVAQLEKASSGDVVLLAAGNYGLVKIQNRSFAVPLLIKSGNATVRFSINNVNGISIRGGVVKNALGAGPDGYGINIQQSQNVTITSMAIINSQRGVVINESSNVLVANTAMDGMIVDGVDIGLSHHVTIRNVICSNANSGEAHPDCIQMWSRPGNVTQDVLISGVQALGGGMQGITGFNHVRDGVDDGGFDRIRIVGNYVRGAFPQGISLYDCRKCFITDNIVETMPNSPYWVQINAVRSPDIVLRNNIVGAAPN